ncbi:hypothetical protein EGX64_02530 [Staphylococcus epidermidis]|nr:hypothetical protein BUM85_00660 [Staphylococcus epidermidis]ASJ94863.1 hypothetical protein CFE88_11830 [Staphylococcus epidermidis]ATQ48997.1 hypothetical protein CPZ17_00370 [Staphylococcus epidermidis]ATQ58676.1 hypothetical protein CPZ21_00405 [Staphylococcus epidermidis]AYY61452.1 hypothetical protein EGX64_02530 [Staphylococcus epidermidis]
MKLKRGFPKNKTSGRLEMNKVIDNDVTLSSML